MINAVCLSIEQKRVVSIFQVCFKFSFLKKNISKKFKHIKKLMRQLKMLEFEMIGFYRWLIFKRQAIMKMFLSFKRSLRFEFNYSMSSNNLFNGTWNKIRQIYISVCLLIVIRCIVMDYPQYLLPGPPPQFCCVAPKYN